MNPKLTIADIDKDITYFQHSLSLFTRSHPEHIIRVQMLAKARIARYNLSREKQDLDKSIQHYTKAILLPPVSRAGPFLNVVQLLFALASALLVRSEKFEQPYEIKYSIEYFRYLRRFPLDSFDIPRSKVTTLLIRALGIQVESEAGDGTPNIKEIVVLCRELLTSNISVDFPVVVIRSLNRAVNAEVNRGRPIQLLDEVIECLREAVKVCPLGSYDVLFALGNQLYTRFKESYSNEDYEEATSLFERILDPNQPGECPDSIRNQVSVLSTQLALFRSTFFHNQEYSEVSISRLRTLLSSSSVDGSLRVLMSNMLAIEAREHFTQYSLPENLEEANSHISQVVNFSFSESLENSGELFLESDEVRETYSATAIQQKIQHLEELRSRTPPGTRRHTMCLSHLASWYESKFRRTNGLSDIEESIKYCRLTLDATHSSDTWRTSFLCSLRNTLFLAFEKTSKIIYLNESITLGYDILELKNSQPVHFYVIWRLVQSLLTREKLLGGREDRHEAIRLLSLVIDNQYVREPDRFQLSCEWAVIARNISHPTTLTAYKSAMSLLQKSLSFAPTVSIQHTRLVAMGESRQTMPLDYTSYQIHSGRFEEAIETLEQGRALLWSEMRGLRVANAQVMYY